MSVNLMRIDGYMVLKFRKLRPFSIKDFYFNPCRLKIEFKKEMNIDGVIDIEFDRCETIEDDYYVYSALHGFTPQNVDEEFVDRLFKSLVAMMKNLDPIKTYPKIIMESIDNPEDCMGHLEYEGFEIVRYPYGKKKSE